MDEFRKWHSELYSLAVIKECEFLIPMASYYPRDGYEEGNTPEEELSELISRAAGDC